MGDVPERVVRAVGALPVWIASPLALLLRDIAVSLRAARALVSFIQIAPSRVTPLLPALLPPTHRRGHQQHHQHDRDRDDDHDDTGTNRERRGVKSDTQSPPPRLWPPDNRISAEAPRSGGTPGLLGLATLGQPVEVAPAYVYLASQKSSYVSGDVTGGTPIGAVVDVLTEVRRVYRSSTPSIAHSSTVRRTCR